MLKFANVGWILLAALQWVAMSTTAMSITGDVTLTADRLTMARKQFPLTLVREIESGHLADAGKIVSSLETPASAKLYKTSIGAGVKLLHGNTLCGPGKDARWMLVVFGKGHLSLAFYSGDREPDLASDRELCGTYGYSGESSER